MNSKEWFALFIRAVGVVGIIFILRHALEWAPDRMPPVYLIVKWVIGALIGIYLVRGAPGLIKFSYPSNS